MDEKIVYGLDICRYTKGFELTWDLLIDWDLWIDCGFMDRLHQ